MLLDGIDHRHTTTTSISLHPHSDSINKKTVVSPEFPHWLMWKGEEDWAKVRHGSDDLSPFWSMSGGISTTIFCRELKLDELGKLQSQA